jgi:hypothetical protein
MKKLLFVVLFAVSTNGFADMVYKWVNVYVFDTSEMGSIFDYSDESYVDLMNTMQSYQVDSTNELIPGETYKLRITYDNTIDSCYAIYDFVPESYELDGFWTYANTGLIVSPDDFYGIYNIQLDPPYLYNLEEYPDEEPDFYTWLGISSGTYFKIGLTGLSHIRIEIQVYKEVEE